jgi:uncharacterized protein (TIGR01370 family)
MEAPKQKRGEFNMARRISSLGRTLSRRGALAAMAALAFPPLWSLGGSAVPAAPGKNIRWVVYYGQTADERTLATYDIVVLDPGFMGSLEAIAASGAQVYGYLSIGEISTSNPFFETVADGAILGQNNFWQGVRHMDVRHPSWRSVLLDKLVPAIAAQGFAGLMLDTLDTPPYLEQIDPGRHRGMAEAAVDLVHAIRSERPGMKLIMNRGYALLPRLADSLDGLIAESLLTRPDPKTGGANWVKSEEVAQQLALIQPAARERSLPIFSLDYWRPEDKSTIKEIYKRERALGHHPYVSTPLLDRIMPEPVLS